jgi:hypothetical protein
MDKTLEQLVDEESMQNNGEKLLYAEDMIEFARYVLDNISYNNDKLEEMLFTWKKQQIKTIYYE